MSAAMRMWAAELLRSRRTFTYGSLIIPALLAVWCVQLASAALADGLAATDGRWNGNALGWLSFYPAMVALPVGALVGAMAQWREQRCREGGTAWRAVSPRGVMVARAGVLALTSLGAQVALFVPILTHAFAITGAGWGPVSQYGRFIVLAWVSVTGAAIFGVICAQLMGGLSVGVAPVAAAVWSTIGAMQAESANWLVRPWTWFMRGSVPLLGVHGNSVNLEPDAPGWDIAAGPMIALQTLLAFVALGVLVTWFPRPLMFRRRSARRTTPVADVAPRPMSGVVASGAAPGQRSVVLAMMLALPWRIWGGLAVVQVAVVVGVRVVYGATAASALLALVGVPVTATVVAVMAHASVRDAWRSLLMRASALRLMVGMGVPASIFAVGALVVATVAAWDGHVYMVLTLPAVTVMLLAVVYAITHLFGIPWAVAVSVFGLLAGVVIGGNEGLAGSTLWAWAPWGWSWVAATYPERWVVVVGLSGVLAVLSLVIAARWGRGVTTGSE